jgi:nucleoid-associated protein YgaU
MKRTGVAFCFVILLSFIISCRINLPIVEMTRARLTITQAYEVKADKYALELLQEAEQHLYSSHDFGIKDDIDDSKKEAELSFKCATDAINKALPLLAGDTLESAKSIHAEADKLNAEKFAAEEFTKSGTLISESAASLESKAYRESYKGSQEAITSDTAAKEKSLQQIPTIQQTMNDLTKERDQLLASPDKAAGLDDLNKAGESLTRAGTALTAQELKTACSENDQATQLITAARNKIAKVSSKDKIASIRREIQTLKSERGAEFAGDDITVAESSVNEAESLIEQDRASDSLMKMKDAEDALGRARGRTTKGIATEKIQSAESLLEKTKGKDEARGREDKITEASSLIDEGKQLLQSESYEGSIAKSDEAINVLNSLSITREIDSGKGSTIEINDGVAANTYTVIYNKRRPDCLWRIAERMYHNARLWPLIYVANKTIIRDPDLIFPGQRFQIPPIPKQKSMAEQQEKETQSVQQIEEQAADSTNIEKEPAKEEAGVIEKE